MRDEKSLMVPEALRRLDALVGEYAWWVHKGADDVLSLEFGHPHLVVHEPIKPAQDSSRTVVDVLGRRLVEPTGKWRLFIEDGDWAVVTKSYGTRRFDTDHVRADAALRQLDSQKLASVDYLYATNTWHFRFDLGGSLTIDRSTLVDNARSEESVWVLFCEDGACFAFSNDTRARQKA